jgi:hypothetical protein
MSDTVTVTDTDTDTDTKNQFTNLKPRFLSHFQNK